MVKLTRIYTRGGDGGETSLGDGTRIAKSSTWIDAIGDVDEANAILGLARLHTANVPAIDAALARIQNDLFDLGADLCVPVEDSGEADTALRIVPTQIERLEREIDLLNEHLAPLDSFILPGGSALAAHLHHARTVARRAERAVVALAGSVPVTPAARQYLNRLSDYLFVLGRHANDDGRRDVLWVPAQGR